jgi:hypothetical protein
VRKFFHAVTKRNKNPIHILAIFMKTHMARLHTSKRAIHIILTSHCKNTTENLSHDVKRNNGKGNEHDVTNDLRGKGVSTEHLTAEEDQQDLHGADGGHNEEKSFIFSDVRQEADTARSRIEGIKDSA